MSLWFRVWITAYYLQKLSSYVEAEIEADIFLNSSLNVIHHHRHHYQRNASYLIFDHKECPSCVKELHHIPSFSTSILEALLEGNNKSYSDSNATLVVLRSGSNQTIEAVGEVMDKFVSPRPWWIVEVEPYAWMPWLRDVILLRVPQKIWRHFDAISRQNYRTAEECAVTPLMISGHTHDAWGNRMNNVDAEWGNLLQAVFLVYTTDSGKTTDTMGFVEASVCPDLVNKWECVFLPTTNCTLPKQLTDCHDRSCIPSMSSASIYSNASAVGLGMTEHEQDIFLRSVRESIPIIQGLQRTGSCLLRQGYHSETPLTLIDEATTVVHNPQCNIDVIGIVFNRGFVFRFNSLFRSLVAHKMFSFRLESDPPFLPSSTCISAHIRMHDRSIPGVDMVQYCLNCTAFDANGGISFNCTGNRAPWYDYGCFSRAPFGALTLDHFLNASRVLLPNNRNFFVMTDDPAWLEAQLVTYRQRSRDENTFNIYAFPAAANHRLPSSSATVDFWASVKLAQQCEAFVGHFSSASTALVYNSMCFRRAFSKFLDCPRAYDLGAFNL